MRNPIKRHHLEWAVAIIAVVVLVLVTILFARGTTTNTTLKPVVQAVQPQQVPAVKAVQQSNVAPTLKQQDSLPCPPPPGEGVVGACAPKPVQLVVKNVNSTPKVKPVQVDPPTCTPDVSNWQGFHIDWGAVKRWQVSRGCTPSGIFKIGEYTTPDSTASTNNAGLKANGMVRQGYWFVRRLDCSTEARAITTEANGLGLKVVWLDVEVPEAAGMANCLTPLVKSAGITVGTYASPGAFPGGSPPNPAWIAAYGPATPPAAPWGGPIKAFQCTDGVFGCKTYVPGIGYGDVSVDYGATKLGQKAVPLCSTSMCYSRFSTVVWKAPKPGPCHAGCAQRQYMRYWQGARNATHAHRLALRYRGQKIQKHLEYEVAHGHNTQRTRQLAHIFWAWAYQAKWRGAYNLYLKVTG